VDDWATYKSKPNGRCCGDSLGHNAVGADKKRGGGGQGRYGPAGGGQLQEPGEMIRNIRASLEGVGTNLRVKGLMDWMSLVQHEGCYTTEQNKGSRKRKLKQDNC
jgi:hypothetical protein